MPSLLWTYSSYYEIARVITSIDVSILERGCWILEFFITNITCINTINSNCDDGGMGDLRGRNTLVGKHQLGHLHRKSYRGGKDVH